MDQQYAPQFFGIILEEHGVEDFAETVDVEVLKRFLLTLEECTVNVTAACLYGSYEPHGNECGWLDGYWIIKEMSEIVDTANPVAIQHDGSA